MLTAAKKRPASKNPAKNSEVRRIRRNKSYHNLKQLVAMYGNNEGEDPDTRAFWETAFTDVLADLRHLADEVGVDLANQDRIAHEHYMVEVSGNGD